MFLSSYLNSDIGNSVVVTNFIIGLAYLIIAICFKNTKLVQLEYRDPLAILCAATGLQFLVRIFAIPALVQTSLDTLLTMVVVAVAIVLVRDSSIR